MASLSEFAAAVILAVILAGDSSSARDLRPSDHGFVFQSSPPANNSSSMRSFFNGDGSSSSSSASSSDASQFPEATNFTGSLPPSWWKGAEGGGGRRVGGALVVASVVCGVTGVALLVASGLLYLFKHRRKSELNAAFRNDSDLSNRNVNKLQLVAAPVVRNR